MTFWERLKVWISEGSLMLAALFAIVSALAFYKLPVWLGERFGEVSAEQLAFFLKNPIKGADPAVQASFIDSLIKEPLIIASIAVLPAIIVFIILHIFRLDRTNEEIARQIPAPNPLKGAALALLFLTASAEAVFPFMNKGKESVIFYNPKPSENVLADPRFLIAHAGGAINGAVYTNSRESIENSINSGFKIIELDLDKTSDGEIAALHDWDYFRGITKNEKNGKAMPQADFLAQKIYGKYSPLNVAAINDFFEKNADTVLVTDKIKDFNALLKNFKFTKRLIVEVFSYSDYDKALEAGIIYPALNLNSIGKAEIDRILKKKIKMVTISDVFLEQNREEILCLHRKGITVMLYAPTKVINNPEYLKSVLGKTVSLAYVDFCSPKNPECRR
ncbi:MAG: hypothetical protein K5838_04465 [Elusimicrobiales bacterium]|nr:hypothetical protein [Elusimicrobiales bacterium]